MICKFGRYGSYCVVMKVLGGIKKITDVCLFYHILFCFLRVFNVNVIIVNVV